MTRMMMAARGWIAVALLGGIALFAPRAIHAQSYTITDLGTLGGSASSADGINELGEVTVGFGEEDHAILWQNGVMTGLGTLGGGASQALAINEASQIVGWSEDGNPESTPSSGRTVR